MPVTKKHIVERIPGKAGIMGLEAAVAAGERIAIGSPSGDSFRSGTSLMSTVNRQRADGGAAGGPA